MTSASHIRSDESLRDPMEMTNIPQFKKLLLRDVRVLSINMLRGKN